MKATKIIVISLVIVLIVGAVFLKYVKPKLDVAKENQRLKEADLLAKATAKTSASTSSDASNIAAILPAPILGVGGTVVESK